MEKWTGEDVSAFNRRLRVRVAVLVVVARVLGTVIFLVVKALWGVHLVSC